MHFVFLKMSYGASYAPWHADQFLLGHPSTYGVWHPYKYFVEMTHRALIPIAKFLEQRWDLKVGAEVPLEVKLCHMEKTIVGLLLATAANKTPSDSTTQVPLDNYTDLTDVQSDAFWDHKPCCIPIVQHCLPWVFLFVNVIGMIGQPLPPLLLRNVLQ